MAAELAAMSDATRDLWLANIVEEVAALAVGDDQASLFLHAAAACQRP